MAGIVDVLLETDFSGVVTVELNYRRPRMRAVKRTPPSSATRSGSPWRYEGDRDPAKRAVAGRVRMYQPPDALLTPLTGLATYARLPYVTDLEGVQCAVFGMPWDGGASFRPGARFGPEAIRSASGMIRTYNVDQGVQVFGRLFDGRLRRFAHGARIYRGHARTDRRVHGAPRPSWRRDDRYGWRPFDDARRAARAGAAARAAGLVHFDSHTDLWDRFWTAVRTAGTMFRRALEEGVVEASRVVQAGMTGRSTTRPTRAFPTNLAC